jgi:hypothetical protein
VKVLQMLLLPADLVVCNLAAARCSVWHTWLSRLSNTLKPVTNQPLLAMQQLQICKQRWCTLRTGHHCTCNCTIAASHTNCYSHCCCPAYYLILTVCSCSEAPPEQQEGRS